MFSLAGLSFNLCFYFKYYVINFGMELGAVKSFKK